MLSLRCAGPRQVRMRRGLSLSTPGSSGTWRFSRALTSPAQTVKLRLDQDNFGISISRQDASMLKTNKRKGGFNKRNELLKTTSNDESFIELNRLWLRDNCKCSTCVNQDTQQRSFDTFQIPEGIEAQSSENLEEGMRVRWNDGHDGYYPWNWFRAILQKESPIAEKLDQVQMWNAQQLIKSGIPEVDYTECMTDGAEKGMSFLMQHLKTSGVAFVSGTPVTPEATQQLLEKIGPIRNTHYGGFYDFIPDLASADTAYTNEALAPHTDTTYFTEPAGLQAFHMLSHEPAPNQKEGSDTLGGLSTLVDGFAVAQHIRETNPALFKDLCSMRIPWHASGNADASISPDQCYPVIETNGDHVENNIRRIRWNNDDRGVVPLELAGRWYSAARRWSKMVNSKHYKYFFQMEPGKVLIFNNWRVLHGRTAFEGRRRICGGYINRDDFISRWKISNFRDSSIDYNQTLQHRGVSNVKRMHGGDLPGQPRKPREDSAAKSERIEKGSSGNQSVTNGPSQAVSHSEAADSEK